VAVRRAERRPDRAGGAESEPSGAALRRPPTREAA
jgi:hypothetical protein